jgi:hypothetical protein
MTGQRVCQSLRKLPLREEGSTTLPSLPVLGLQLSSVAVCIARGAYWDAVQALKPVLKQALCNTDLARHRSCQRPA